MILIIVSQRKKRGGRVPRSIQKASGVPWPPPHLTSHPQGGLSKPRKERQEEGVVSRLLGGTWGFSTTQRERIPSSGCSLKTGPQKTQPVCQESRGQFKLGLRGRPRGEAVTTPVSPSHMCSQ